MKGQADQRLLTLRLEQPLSPHRRQPHPNRAMPISADGVMCGCGVTNPASPSCSSSLFSLYCPSSRCAHSQASVVGVSRPRTRSTSADAHRLLVPRSLHSVALAVSTPTWRRQIE